VDALTKLIRREIIRMVIHPTVNLRRALELQGAISSVALSHPETCDCLTCRAAAGDVDAFAQIYNDIIEGEQREHRDDRS